MSPLTWSTTSWDIWESSSSRAHRIDSNTFGAGSVEDVAFQNPDGSIVLFVLNSASNAGTFVVSFKGQSFNYTLPAGAVATYTWK